MYDAIVRDWQQKNPPPPPEADATTHISIAHCPALVHDVYITGNPHLQSDNRPNGVGLVAQRKLERHLQICDESVHWMAGKPSDADQYNNAVVLTTDQPVGYFKNNCLTGCMNCVSGGKYVPNVKLVAKPVGKNKELKLYWQLTEDIDQHGELLRQNTNIQIYRNRSWSIY